MKISRFSVSRPKLTSMLVFIVVLIGFMSYTKLPIDLMPDITYPSLTVMANYDNASPEEVEEMVTRIIESALSAVPGVEEMTSVSSEGRSRVRLSFDWGTDLDAASNDVRDRLDRIISRLPDNMDRPTLRKFDPSSMPIMTIGASSSLDPIQLRRIIDEQVKYRIERISGVASLDIRGGLEREIQVNLDINRTKALGISLDQVISSIRASNINRPAGVVEQGNYEVIVRTPGQYSSISEIRETVVAYVDGNQVRLRDIASIKDTAPKVTRIVRIDGSPGVTLAVTKQSGSNTVEVAKNVLKEVERINQDISQIELTPIIDSSEHIQRSIHSVTSAALYGGGFAIIILLLFLRSMSSTLIISASIPISIIASFALIYFSGFTLNIISLGGLALGIGMLVDNAIVVLENIFRLRENGMDPISAAVEGSHEVTGAVIASTLTTVAVFFPLVFMEGMAGIIFKQMALVVGFALLCSLIVSLTVVPMLASKYLKHSRSKNKNMTLLQKTYDISCVLFFKLENLYRSALHYALFHRIYLISGTAILLIISLMLSSMIGSELMPQTDEGEVRVNAEMEVGTRLSILDDKFKLIESIIEEEVIEKRTMVASVGGGGWWATGGHTGQVRIALNPLSERNRASSEIADALRSRLSNIPGTTVRARAGTSMVTWMMGGGGGAERIQLEIRGHDLGIADYLSLQIKDMLEGIDGITDALVSRDTGNPEELIIINRIKAADMGISISNIAQVLQIGLGGVNAGYFRERGNEYRIFVRFENADQINMEDMLNLTINNYRGEPILLANVVERQAHKGPVSISRKDQERIVTVSANTGDRDMSLIVADVRENLNLIAVPEGFSIMLAGEYEEQQKAFGELGGVLIIALLLVYMVMVSLYESFRDPFVVMFSVPLAAIGVIWMLFITGTTFNMQSFIGCIMLGGIVVNNAIVLVDQINLLRQRDKMPLVAAIEESGRRRLRPILMTAFTTMFALIPMALGLGEGGEFQAPLARAVIGGLFSASLITLFIVPIVYYMFEKSSENKKITG